MSTITPTSKQHPLIIKVSMKSLYQEVIKCKMCPRLVDFREKKRRSPFDALDEANNIMLEENIDNDYKRIINRN